MSVALVCFDAGNTLFTERTSRGAMYADVLGEFGIRAEPAQVARWLSRAHDELPEVFEGHVRYSDGWFRELVARLLRRAGAGAGVDPERVRARAAEHFTRPGSYTVFADTVPTLSTLAARGVRAAVVSNWSDRLGELLTGLGLAAFFEHIVISAVVGISKPDPRIFDHALRACGVPAHRALHVGDHAVKDVEAARRAGLGALLLDRSPGAEGREGTVPSLTGVLDHLDREFPE